MTNTMHDYEPAETIRYILAVRGAERLTDCVDYLRCADTHGAPTRAVAHLAAALAAELAELVEDLRRQAITAAAQHPAVYDDDAAASSAAGRDNGGA